MGKDSNVENVENYTFAIRITLLASFFFLKNKQDAKNKKRLLHPLIGWRSRNLLLSLSSYLIGDR